MKKKNRRVFLLLLLLFLILAALLMDSMIVYPVRGPRGFNYIIMFIFLAFSVNIGFSFFQSYMSHERLRWLVIIVKWVCTFVLPLIMISPIEGHIRDLAVKMVIEEYSPVVEYLNKNNNANPVEILKQLPKTSDVYQFSYYQREDGFIASTWVGASDLDGYIMYFDSRAQQWQIFHSDYLFLYKSSPDQITNPKVIVYATKTKKDDLIRSISYEKSRDSWKGRCDVGCPSDQTLIFPWGSM